MNNILSFLIEDTLINSYRIHHKHIIEQPYPE